MKKTCQYFLGIILLLTGLPESNGADWCVQVSTFRNLDGIKQDYHKVKNKPDARIEKIEGIYSLRVGFYQTENQAKEAMKSIKGDFAKAFVRKCDNKPDRVIESSGPAKRTGEVKSAVKSVEKPSQNKAEKAKVTKPSALTAKLAASPPPAAVPTPPVVPVPAAVTTPPPAGATPTAAMPPLPPGVKLSTPMPSASENQPAGAPVESSDPQKLYAEAERLRLNGNHTLAIDLYKKVIQLAPANSELSGRASYRTALCYDIINDKRSSESGYAQAIDKWPGLDVAPQKILYDGGMRTYGQGRYDAALKIFSMQGMAYPIDALRMEYLMACTLMLQGRHGAAMLMFSRIIENHPDSSEAVESIVAFGHMGMMVPKIKATMFTKGYEYYRDPIHAYDTALKKQQTEHVLFAKSCALMNLGRYEDAQRALLKCLKSYSSSPKIRTYRAAAGLNIMQLLKIHSEKGDDAAIVGLYFQAMSNDIPLPVDATTATTIGKSLHRMGLTEDASNYLKASRIKASSKDAEEITKAIDDLSKPAVSVKVCEDILKEYRDIQTANQAVSPRLAVRAADCLYAAKQYGACIPIYRWTSVQPLTKDEHKWILLRMGQASLKAGREDDAKKSFDELKASGADEFWSKLVDFAYEDGRWTKKYNQTTKSK